MPSMPYGYFDRTDPTKNYEKHLFIAGAGLQSAELNEVQENATARIRSVADALFKDGDVIRDASLVVDANTGDVAAMSGSLYVRGAVRGVAPRGFNIATSGTVVIGVYLIETVVTALEDDTLRDPATGTRNYQEPGAARLQVEPVWGWAGERSDADFFPIYEVVDGYLKAKEAPPSVDVISQAIARYDRDSAGGTYVVGGMRCQKLPDIDGKQMFSVQEGKARVLGLGFEYLTATRLAVVPEPDLKFIDSEPHTSTTTSAQRFLTSRSPIANITTVKITAEKTATITHGAYSGCTDPLPDSSVLEILSVVQGGTTYIATTDYVQSGDAVSWAPTGAEPATGSTYQVTYRYITAVEPTDVDSTGFSVTGAVVGTLVLVSYNQSLPRYDRIFVATDGTISYLKGVSAEWTPRIPEVPAGLLPLATIFQTWDGNSVLTNDGVRVVPMHELAAINGRIDYLLGMVAQQQLESNINMREAGSKKGMFTDPFLDDSQRDAGIEQTAAIFDGILTIPVSVDVTFADDRGSNMVSLLNKVEAASVQQLSRTGSMQVNPYQSFAPIPAKVSITPSVDRWSVHETVWTSPSTRAVISGSGVLNRVTSATSTVLLSSVSQESSILRQIEVQFTLDGFGAGETLASVLFDGIEVTPVAL